MDCEGGEIKVGANMQRGQVISFRLPSETSDHILKYLQRLKETEGRKFSKKLSELLMKGIGVATDQESIIIPINQTLTKEQKEWLKHEQSEVILRNLVYQILTEPTSSIGIKGSPVVESKTAMKDVDELDDFDDDLSNFDFDFSKQREEIELEVIEEDPLASFLSSMNK